MNIHQKSIPSLAIDNYLIINNLKVNLFRLTIKFIRIIRLLKFLEKINMIFCINIVINYTDMSGCPKKFVAVTTLYEDEFTDILSYFSERWRIHERRYALSNTW